MPRIEKLVSIDGRLGVILDVPPTPVEGDSVTIYSAVELALVLKLVLEKERQACAEICRELAETWATTEREQDALERAAIEIERTI